MFVVSMRVGSRPVRWSEFAGGMMPQCGIMRRETVGFGGGRPIDPIARAALERTVEVK